MKGTEVIFVWPYNNVVPNHWGDKAITVVSTL